MLSQIFTGVLFFHFLTNQTAPLNFSWEIRNHVDIRLLNTAFCNYGMLKYRWVVMVEYQHFLKKTTSSAGKAQSMEAKTQYLKELSISSRFHSLLITPLSLPKWSLKQAAFILMSMFMATSAWTFFRYQSFINPPFSLIFSFVFCAYVG